ncbi:MAG: OmpA family protein [Nitrospinaceae bacterium]
MKCTTKSIFRTLINISAFIAVLGFATGCSKQLLPFGSSPEAPPVAEGSGIQEEDVAGGSQRSFGNLEPGFGVKEQTEKSQLDEAAVAEETIDESGQQVFGDASAPDFTKNGDRNFGRGKLFKGGSGSQGFFETNERWKGSAPLTAQGTPQQTDEDGYLVPQDYRGAGGLPPDFNPSADREFGAGERFDGGSGSRGYYAADGRWIPAPATDVEPGSAPAARADAGTFRPAPRPRNGGVSSSGFQQARLMDFKENDQLRDIYFGFDHYDLTEESKRFLRENADWLKENPRALVEIQGHCDARGTNNYNLGLSERRALSTKKYLMALGVDSQRIKTISYGEEKPFCFESGENCWWKNRRAHFMVTR